MPELVRRYMVMPLATEAPFDPADPDGAFVLRPWKDPAALRALRAYRDSCFPELRRDLDAWIRTIEAGPTVRGDIGRRNEPFVAPTPAAGTTQARGPADVRPSAKTAASRKATARSSARTDAAPRKPSRTRAGASASAKPSAATRGPASSSTKAARRGPAAPGAKPARGGGSKQARKKGGR